MHYKQYEIQQGVISQIKFNGKLFFMQEKISLMR